MDTITTFWGFLETIATLTIDVKNLCVKFSILFIVMTAIYGVVKFFFAYEDGGKINFKKYLFTPLILAFLLVNYPYFIDITGKMGSILVNNTPGAGDKDHFTAMFKSITQRSMNEVDEANRQHLQDFKDNEGSKFAFWKNSLSKLTKDIKNMTTTILAPMRIFGKLFEFGFIKVCRIIIEQARNVILGFLIIVGPLSLLFSITPVFRDVFKKWFRIYVGVLLWAVSINLLDEMVIRYQEDSVESSVVYLYEDEEAERTQDASKRDYLYMTNGVTNFGGESGFINFIFGIMYLAVPLLTSFFIGDKMAAGMLSMVMMKTFEYSMKGVQMAGGAMGVPPGGGGGGKGSIGGVG